MLKGTSYIPYQFKMKGFFPKLKDFSPKVVGEKKHGLTSKARNSQYAANSFLLVINSWQFHKSSHQSKFIFGIANFISQVTPV